VRTRGPTYRLLYRQHAGGMRDCEFM
jgi:hypothetical protein